ncbi:MAG: glycosyltransferase family 9 protein [Anaerolineae bacterium]
MRIALIKACCIGDVIFTTPLLAAVRRALPDAEITFGVGSSALEALRDHPKITQLLEVGAWAVPSRLRQLATFVHLLRRGRYDLLLVPDRSRWYSLAAALSGIPRRVGLDSGGRGFGYTLKARIDPRQIRHEADIYLDIGRVLGIDVSQVWAEAFPSDAAQAAAAHLMARHGLKAQHFLILHPGGGVNAGMSLTSKRWPPQHFAALAHALVKSPRRNPMEQVVLIGAPSDAEPLAQLRAALTIPSLDLSRQLTLAEIAALAAQARLYIGNDNGVGHLAAAAGAKVLMIFGPSDPRRYAPYVPPSRARFAWREVPLPSLGVADGPIDFDWIRDGISVDEVLQIAQALID